MKKPTAADQLKKALADIELLKAQVAALQAQVALLGRPAVQPYQPHGPRVNPPRMPWEDSKPFFVEPPYEGTCGSPPPKPEGYTVRRADAMRLTHGLN